MQERLIGGGVVAAIFLPLLFIGGLPFQLLVGAMAMVAVSEMLRMKHLEIFSIEGILSMVAAFILAVPIDRYFISLPTNASVTGFAVISFLILAGTVLNSDHYSFDDAAYPIASAFLVSKISLQHVWIVGKRFSLPFLLFGQRILGLTFLVVNLVRISYCQKYHQIRLLKVVLGVSYQQSLWLLSLV